MMGNYFGEVVDKPKRPISLLKRTLTGRTLAGRRFSDYSASAPRSPGLLARAFSLSRHPRKDTGYFDRMEPEPMYPTPEDRPKEEDKLHAFWRPAYADRLEDSEDEDWVRDVEDGETYRYPPVDNRPSRPRRTLSLSDRFKRTFAILPVRESYDQYYSVDEPDGTTVHRTIRRTPSGNLRVVKHRRSLDSLRPPRSADQRPYTAPDHGGRPGLWRTYSLSRALGGTMEKYGLHNLPRRLSERRREKRSQELRQKISAPREVRDGVGDVIRRNSYREAFNEFRHG
jgi:hypothetical protein